MIDPGWIASAQAMVPGLLLHMRLFLGWSSIVIGILGTILPIIPGLPFLLIGAHLIGRRDRRLRWARVHTRLAMRRAAQSQVPMVRTAGQWARRSNYEVVRYGRKWRAQRAGAMEAARTGWAADQSSEAEQPASEDQPARPRRVSQRMLVMLRPWGESALHGTAQGIRYSIRGMQHVARSWRKPPQRSEEDEPTDSRPTSEH
jgi:hypothetical protein